MSVEFRFFLDENLPRSLTRFLRTMKVPIDSVQRGIDDEVIVRRIGEHRHRGVWITQDIKARVLHRSAILDSGISVAWLHSGSGPPLKAALLAVAFVYRFGSQIETSNLPLYFDVREVSFQEGTSAVVSVQTEL